MSFANRYIYLLRCVHIARHLFLFSKAREREEEHAADAANARLLLSRWRQKRGYVISEKAQTLLHELESNLYGCWVGGGPAEFYYSEAQGLYRCTLQGIVEEQRQNT